MWRGHSRRIGAGTSGGESMASEVREVDLPGILEQHQVRYEVRAYYVVSEPGTSHRIQAGFDVYLYGILNKMVLPLYGDEEGRKVVDYFQTAAQRIQSKWAKEHTTIEVVPYEDSLILDTHQHFQPEAVLQIRISHDRGLGQPAGPSEDQALDEFREVLHELHVKQV
jgi:hypothetical protein